MVNQAITIVLKQQHQTIIITAKEIVSLFADGNSPEKQELLTNRLKLFADQLTSHFEQEDAFINICHERTGTEDENSVGSLCLEKNQAIAGTLQRYCHQWLPAENRGANWEGFVSATEVLLRRLEGRIEIEETILFPAIVEQMSTGEKNIDNGSNKPDDLLREALILSGAMADEKKPQRQDLEEDIGEGDTAAVNGWVDVTSNSKNSDIDPLD